MSGPSYDSVNLTPETPSIEGRAVPTTTVSTGMVVRHAEPARPKATIYALHGGGLNGTYWDCKLDRSLSLVALGNELGFRVAFADRPGYGVNRDLWPDGVPAIDEGRLHAAAARELWADEPVLLVGQSAGSIVALWSAAYADWPRLVGVDYSGIGISLRAQSPEREDRRALFWGREDLYPPGTFAPGGRPVEAVVGVDGISSVEWKDRFADVAARVTVPVRITIVDHERWWGEIDEIVASKPPAFTSAPVVTVSIEHEAGHNLSLGYAARAYHLRVIAFAEECLRRA